MSETKPAASTPFVQRKLPWIGTGIALLVYLFTLNHWITFESLPVVSKVATWDWNATVTSPLLHLTTLPFRLLPETLIPVALNAYAAVCAALTIGLLMRSVALLPHDRTREQRQRERSRNAFLSISLAWIPPVGAALACGLQLTFWEHSTAITGHLLNLLIFAYVIRCLLEFRIEERNSWLFRAAFVYGLGITNSYAMIGFLPLFIVALVWIKGMKFFEYSFLTKMAGLGALGLLFYLFLPILEIASGNSDLTFWQLLKSQWVVQKNFLLFGPLRNRALILSFTSIVPVAFLGIRWPSSFGDMSAAGAFITTIMFRLIHALFLVGCLYVAFDPPYSPRQLGFGLPFLTFYYLGALSIGYYSGYLLLVYGREPERKWRRSGESRFFNRAMAALTVIAVLGAPIGLAAKNWSAIQANNSPLLRQLAQEMASELPEDQPAYVLSDDPEMLLLAMAGDSLQNPTSRHIFLDTAQLKWKNYHERFKRQYPELWHSVELEEGKQTYPNSLVIQALEQLAGKAPIFYLQPSFGYLFERFYQVPDGIVYHFRKYRNEAIIPPELSDSVIEENQTFWETFLRERKSSLIDAMETGNAAAKRLALYYSRAMNNWGVTLQRNDHQETAGEYFQAALELNPDNLAAEVNANVNAALLRGESGAFLDDEAIQKKMQKYSNDWEALLGECGPVDEPEFCFRYGKIMERNGFDRQAAHQYARAWELDPSRVDAAFELADIYQRNGIFQEVLAVVEKLKSPSIFSNLSMTNRLLVARIEAWAHYGSGDMEGAERVLRAANKQYPDSPKELYILAQMHAQKGDYSKALDTLQELFQRFPNNIQALVLESAILIKQEKLEEALRPLNEVLNLDPKNREALINRAWTYFLSEDWESARQDYESLLKAYPEMNSARLKLAQIAENQQNRQEALRLYRRFLEDEPENSKEREVALEKIDALEGIN